MNKTILSKYMYQDVGLYGIIFRSEKDEATNATYDMRIIFPWHELRRHEL